MRRNEVEEPARHLRDRWPEQHREEVQATQRLPEAAQRKLYRSKS
jgi:hypothetical protein